MWPSKKASLPSEREGENLLWLAKLKKKKLERQSGKDYAKALFWKSEVKPKKAFRLVCIKMWHNYTLLKASKCFELCDWESLELTVVHLVLLKAQTTNHTQESIKKN